MDRLIYTAMTGATQSLEQQSVVANNLANASTTGFRAQLATFRAVPMNFEDGSGNVDPATTRTYTLSSTRPAGLAAGARPRPTRRQAPRHPARSSRASSGCPRTRCRSARAC